jgi:hypothetical protein
MAPTPGGVYCGENKMLTSFQIEIFLGFFLTAKLHDLNPYKPMKDFPMVLRLFAPPFGPPQKRGEGVEIRKNGGHLTVL